MTKAKSLFVTYNFKELDSMTTMGAWQQTIRHGARAVTELIIETQSGGKGEGG